MGTSVDAVLAEKLQRDIRIACKSLEEIGYDSLVIVLSQYDQTQMGSERGVDFVDRFDLMEEFQRYCEDELEKDNAVKYQEISDTEESKQFSEQFDSATVSEANISEEEFSIFEGGELEELYSADEVVDADLDIKPQGLIEGNVDIMEPYPISVRGASTASVAVKEEPPSVTGTPVRGQKKAKDKKRFECLTCKKIFARAENLAIHERAHTGEKPYKCEICGKSFVSKGQLNNHASTHSDRTPYSCEECGMLFKRADYLWRHKALHSDTYRYTCDVCGRGYDDPTSLKNHTRRHTGEKPHSCEVCGKSFLYARVLKTHMLIHTGEKPHRCDTCGHMFREKKNLAAHIRRKHTVDTVVSYVVTTLQAEDLPPEIEQA